MACHKCLFTQLSHSCCSSSGWRCRFRPSTAGLPSHLLKNHAPLCILINVPIWTVNSFNFHSSFISFSCECRCNAYGISAISSLHCLCWPHLFAFSFSREHAPVSCSSSTQDTDFSVSIISMCAADFERKLSLELSEVSVLLVFSILLLSLIPRIFSLLLFWNIVLAPPWLTDWGKMIPLLTLVAFLSVRWALFSIVLCFLS